MLQTLYGSKVVAISDSRGGIYHSQGLPVGAVIEHKRKTGSVVNLPGAKALSHEDLVELDVDILIPAAMENIITATNSTRIQSRIIA